MRDAFRWFARVVACAVIALLVAPAMVASMAFAAEETAIPAEHLEFFESKVRPVLVEHCYECHSGQSKVLKGGLRVDSRAAILKGGDSGEGMIPGKPDESPMIQAVRWDGYEMPPTGKLRPEQIAALEQWVKLGAPWPGTDEAPKPAAGKTYDWKKLQAEHWAFRAVDAPAVPQVHDKEWPKNGLDAFVLAKLEASGLKPNGPAEPRVLIRRLSLDLVGIAPTPAEVEQFEAEASKDIDRAVLGLVDRLLESPQYGERWGRHWLDVARYSDGYGGFLDNAGLPNAWRYRDWVIGALNRDMPYDEFLKLQIAGDLIDPEQAVATGFFALGPTYISDGGDPEAAAQAKAETLDDRVDTLTRGLMGLTVSCARCHDHRFDPYPQLDYYSLAGVLNNTTNFEYPLASKAEVEAYDQVDRRIKEIERLTRQLKTKLRTESRKAEEKEKKQLDDWEAESAKLKAGLKEKYPFVHGLKDADDRDMPLYVRGNPMKPGEIAPRRFLRIVAGEDPPPFKVGSGRLELADAVAAKTNPLTSRVIVNRIWQQHFGHGLVRTPSNFGALGEKPSHPELLDWLASALVDGLPVAPRTLSGSKIPTFKSQIPNKADQNSKGEKAEGSGLALTSSSNVYARPWSLKSLHRLIVTSATYRQDSAPRDDAMAVDGDNRLLWRYSPRRLDVEAWRDSLLSATGELDLTMGGAPTPNIDTVPRRTMYASVSRNGDKFASDAFLRLFDFPAPRATSEGRTQSIVPQQSLFLMNSPFMSARAKGLVARLNKEASNLAGVPAGDDRAKIELAYRLLYSRVPTAEEMKLGREFLKGDAEAAWPLYAQVLLSATELMHLE
jgi:hypothetical protein